MCKRGVDFDCRVTDQGRCFSPATAVGLVYNLTYVGEFNTCDRRRTKPRPCHSFERDSPPSSSAARRSGGRTRRGWKSGESRKPFRSRIALEVAGRGQGRDEERESKILTPLTSHTDAQTQTETRTVAFDVDVDVVVRDLPG